MRQIEITVKLEENLEDALLKLEKKDSKLLEKAMLMTYMLQQMII